MTDTKVLPCLSLGEGVYSCPRPIFSSVASCVGCNGNETFTVGPEDFHSLCGAVLMLLDTNAGNKALLQAAREIANRHHKVTVNSNIEMCCSCNQTWPCDLSEWASPLFHVDVDYPSLRKRATP